jgi:dihydrofolate reductase
MTAASSGGGALLSGVDAAEAVRFAQASACIAHPTSGSTVATLGSTVAAIWAQARDGAGRPVIGAAGAIPWHVPEDFAHFRTLTSGHPVVMGQGTWESLPKRPLPGRTNVVLTLDDAYEADGALVAHTLADALALAARAAGGEEIWIIGGAQIYALTLAEGVVDRLEVTEIDIEIEGDAFAPAIDPGVWQAAAHTDWKSSTNGPRYRFVTYVVDPSVPGDYVG